MKLSLKKIQEKGHQTYPDHVFEIHPVTWLDTMNVTSTIRNITGYEKSPPGSDKILAIDKKAFQI